VWPLEAARGRDLLSVPAVLVVAVLAPTRCPAAGGATMHPAPTPPARNPALSEGLARTVFRMDRMPKPVLLERESMHSCTGKAIHYRRIAAIAASTPI
jgi:hypothetical protein